jgi:hypothetical protein
MSEVKDIKINVDYTGFPNQFASDSEKATDTFGLQVGHAISFQWFKRGGSNGRFYDQWGKFHNLRKYARGEQSVAKYKNELAIDGDLSYLNLDWTPVPIIPKFVDIIVNGMSDRLFKIKAYAQDAMSQSNRSKYQDILQGQMLSKDILQLIQDETGFDPFVIQPDEMPNTDEELALYMQLKYKPAIEIAEEEAINTILEENHYLDLRKRFDYDLTVCGIAVAKHEFLKGSGVKISYVDPANVIYSYTEDPNFKDCFYWGEVKPTHINECLKINPDLTTQDLEEISKYGQAWGNEYNVSQYYDNDMFSRDTVTLLNFSYKTTKKMVYKKKILETGGSKVIEKDDQFNPPPEMMEEGRFEKFEKTVDVWYEGTMVLGTNIILKWELAKNMVRPKSSSQHALSNFVAVAPRMYKGNIESTVGRMITFADQIQITHLKLQQVIARVVPDGVFIDADGLNEVDLGNGAAYNPQDALRLYFQTGSVIGRSQTQDGEFNHARVPIEQLNSSSGANKAQMLISNYEHYLNMIRTVTGLNEARDGSSPDSDSLVGLQKLAALNSNTATRHILESSLYIFRAVSEALTYRVADILEYSDFKDDFVNKIGKYNVSILNDISDLYIYDFGIFLEVTPDEEEKAKLEQNIQMALSRDNINLEDAIDIREVKNLKLANQLLKLKRKQKQEREEKMEMQKQAMISQQNMQSQQMAAKMAAQKQVAETRGKMQIAQAQTAFEIEKMNAQAALKSKLMREEFDYNLQLNTMTEKALQDRENEREGAKGERIDKQNTQQSKLINQRKNNLPPQSFESNEDSLDGFSLREFDPR